MINLLHCRHKPKVCRRLYRCTSTGNYELELCAKCASTESNEFLIREESIEEEYFESNR